MATELNSAPDSAAEVPRGDDEPEEVEEEAGRREDVEVEEHGQAVGQEALQDMTQMKLDVLGVRPPAYPTTLAGIKWNG